jgi:cytochrome c biogenesis protein CcmG/thiol:disulfide interchange protein DsbE
MKGVRWSLWILAAFFALIGLFALQLSRPKDDTVQSTMIGKTVPQFALPAATDQNPGLSSADLADGKPHLLNVFASWCVPCAAEAPQLAALRRAGAPLVGVAVRDQADDLAAFFRQYGNPFARVGEDKVSKLQFLIGSSGVPETYVIDGKGVIRHQHIGMVRPEDIPDLMARLKEAQG